MSKRFSPFIDTTQKFIDLDFHGPSASMQEDRNGDYVLFESHKNTVDQFNKTKKKNKLLVLENEQLKAEIKRLEELSQQVNT